MKTTEEIKRMRRGGCSGMEPLNTKWYSEYEIRAAIDKQDFKYDEIRHDQIRKLHHDIIKFEIIKDLKLEDNRRFETFLKQLLEIIRVLEYHEKKRGLIYIKEELGL